LKQSIVAALHGGGVTGYDLNFSGVWTAIDTMDANDWLTAFLTDKPGDLLNLR